MVKQGIKSTLQGKLYETVFSFLIELPYKVKVFVKTKTAVALNSSSCQKFIILAFTFDEQFPVFHTAVNTFLSLTNNDIKSNDCDLMVAIILY